jgi:hypothetical protein
MTMPRELTEAQVDEARSLYIAGECASKLALRYRVPLVAMRRALFLGDAALTPRKPVLSPRLDAAHRRFWGRGR